LNIIGDTVVQSKGVHRLVKALNVSLIALRGFIGNPIFVSWEHFEMIDDAKSAKPKGVRPNGPFGKTNGIGQFPISEPLFRVRQQLTIEPDFV
jgi:hypothetical protein